MYMYKHWTCTLSTLLEGKYKFIWVWVIKTNITLKTHPMVLYMQLLEIVSAAYNIHI